MGEVLLGIDIGTGSTKGVLARPGGQIVATASRTHRMSLPRPGWAEMDAEAVWWGDVAAICHELLPQAGGEPLAVQSSSESPVRRYHADRVTRLVPLQRVAVPRDPALGDGALGAPGLYVWPVHG